LTLGDGLVSEQEFLNWLSKIKTPTEDDTEQDFRAAFLVFDRDKNGFITRDELKSAMQIIGETLTDSDLDLLLKATDIDKDGKINYEEFIKTLL
jgi:calmodulin